MKKKIMMLAVAAMTALTVSAQGEFKSYEGKGFTMHVYNPNDVKFGSTEKINGVSYLFNNGPKNDFPAATILIGKDFCLMHWAPAKAHMNALQLANRDAVAQALEGVKAAKALGAKYYLGSHGGVATPEDLDFRIAYLTKMEQLLADNKDAASFAQALKNAYPNLPGAEGVDAVAANLYK